MPRYFVIRAPSFAMRAQRSVRATRWNLTTAKSARMPAANARRNALEWWSNFIHNANVHLILVRKEILLIMNDNKKKEKKWDSLKPPPETEPILATTVRKKGEKTVKQHPAKLGHHGTDDERSLNPEE